MTSDAERSRLLRIAFTVAPIRLGLDNSPRSLTDDWTRYLAQVGVTEIVAGLAVLIASRFDVATARPGGPCRRRHVETGDRKQAHRGEPGRSAHALRDGVDNRRRRVLEPARERRALPTELAFQDALRERLGEARCRLDGLAGVGIEWPSLEALSAARTTEPAAPGGAWRCSA